MGFLSGLSSIGGALESFAGAAKGVYDMFATKKENSNNRRFARDQMDKQYKLNQDYAKWSATELPTLNREGMTKAGFNPLLAINEGTGTQGNVAATSATGVAPSLDLTGIGDALSGIVTRKQKQEMIDNQANLQRAEIDNLQHSSAKNDADAALALANAKLAAAQTRYTDRQYDLAGLDKPTTLAYRAAEAVSDFFRNRRVAPDKASSAKSVPELTPTQREIKQEIKQEQQESARQRQIDSQTHPEWVTPGQHMQSFRERGLREHVPFDKTHPKRKHR